MQSSSELSCFDSFNEYFLIAQFLEQQNNKMSEKIRCKANNITNLKVKNKTNVLAHKQFRKNKVSSKFFKKKKEKRLKKNLEIKMVATPRKQCEQRKRTNHRDCEPSYSLTSNDHKEKNSNTTKNKIRKLEIDSLNNLMTIINKEQQSENINSMPTCT